MTKDKICKTPGAQYTIAITHDTTGVLNDAVAMIVKVPKWIKLDLGQIESESFENRIHDAVEEILAPYFAKTKLSIYDVEKAEERAEKAQHDNTQTPAQREIMKEHATNMRGHFEMYCRENSPHAVLWVLEYAYATSRFWYVDRCLNLEDIHERLLRNSRNHQYHDQRYRVMEIIGDKIRRAEHGTLFGYKRGK